jgi:tellurite resistance protein TerC
MELIFPFSEYWGLYLAFSAFVLAMLVLDLGVLHRTAREVTLKEAAVWSGVWIGLALAFNVLLYQFIIWKFSGNPEFDVAHGSSESAASKLGLEFLTGYLVEKALAVDNIFIFLLVFSFFGIPKQYRHRVLFFGILGALVFRVLFIALGSVLMKFHVVVLLFGIFLILTGIKTILSKEKSMDPSKSPALRLLARVLPMTPELHGQKFFSRVAGKWHATPLFAALIFLEVSDIVFAVDSVPAIFAITKEPFIVFTSNIFAILGLRSMYFLLEGVVGKLRYLKHGLGAILVFVGLKMTWLNGAFGGKFPVTWSLGIIAGILALAVIASLWAGRNGNGSKTPAS